jgi:ribosomal protein S17
MQMKMRSTGVIRRDYLQDIKKYNRFEKRQKTVKLLKGSKGTPPFL